ncbi:hypothetical protein [Bosea sp. PAMC 26642]|uniref:hypothetical protein n=1 Tax=Bosea sp. (strain PAMC 26642) TaxID=1792307 RepID=UPI00082A2950|nr:hypothetical protein [Bosea sp. PAMC 26642]
MTNENNKGVPAPSKTGAIENPGHQIPGDPIAMMTGSIGDDPSLSELAAFRNGAPDLKFAARKAKEFLDESMRIRLASTDIEAAHRVAAGLMLVGLSFVATVCIWPSDSLDEVEAKLALVKVNRVHGDDQEDDYAPMLEPDTARRIRVRRAAFNVGELMVPPQPAGPASIDRGLATWPLQGLDLTLLLPQRGGVPVFADQQPNIWSALLTTPPDLDRLADRVERLLATADRLFLLAARPGDNHAELRQAAEGAQIMAYLNAAQVAIWPVERGSAGVKAKCRMAKAIDDRACRSDPLHMQAAVRHIFEESTWLTRLLGAERMAIKMPTWTEIV